MRAAVEHQRSSSRQPHAAPATLPPISPLAAQLCNSNTRLAADQPPSVAGQLTKWAVISSAGEAVDLPSWTFPICVQAKMQNLYVPLQTEAPAIDLGCKMGREERRLAGQGRMCFAFLCWGERTSTVAGAVTPMQHVS